MASRTQYVRRYITWERWQFLYIFLSLSWLFGPSLNHHLSTRTAFISRYEDPSQPWSWLYRICDISAALLLGGAICFIVRHRHNLTVDKRFFNFTLLLLTVIALGSFIDSVFPSSCHPLTTFCLAPNHTSFSIHYYESIITSDAFLLLNILWAVKKGGWPRVVLSFQLLWIVILLIGQHAAHAGNTIAQFGYQIVITLWIASITPTLTQRASPPPRRPRARMIIRAISAWIFIGGFISIISAIRNVKEASDFSAAYFGDNTAWLSQHGIAVGIVLMFISRHVWRGERRAWQLALLLLWLETLKYAVLEPNGWLVALYGLSAATLFILRDSFDRLSSSEGLSQRLRKVLLITGSTLVAVLVGVIAFRLRRHQDLDALKINLSQLTKHLFLLDVVNDFGPLPRRLLGQVLNVAGLTLLLTLLASLFRPKRPLRSQASRHERQQVLKQLQNCSNSSEDYFKYWPQPKLYWWNEDHTAVIAYRIVGNVAFALADPVAIRSEVRLQAHRDFLSYCRAHDWRCCFLMVAHAYRHEYADSGYKLIRIGASAVVNIEEFTSKTIHNKWWRWVRNKSTKQNWKYLVAAPPHSPELLKQLRHVSDMWLQRSKHVERGFALGYFDKAYLQECRLHILSDSNGPIAFANELPIFNNLPTTTIDLMRYLPDRQHAMPTLLAHALQQLHKEGAKQIFDLGFVPLASPTAKTEQMVQKLGQLLMSEAISAQGLEQFKNKFSPSWNNNYMAFDGDWIDLIHISRWLDSLLKL